MKTEKLTLMHDQGDDLPLLIALMQQLRLQELVDEPRGNHGLHPGLSNGSLMMVWLADILSEGDHRKSEGEDGAVQHRHTWEHLIGQPLRREEFTDDRLGNLQGTTEQGRRVSPEITRKEIAMAHQKHRLGWRAQVTKRPKAPMPLDQGVIPYRGGWCHERDFHLLQDRPLGLRPLSVQNEEQMVGWPRLLTLALRVLTGMETGVRKRRADAKQPVVGLYPGQPHRKTARPKARRILKAVARSHIVLTRVEIGEQQFWHLTPLSDVVRQIFSVLGVAPAIYKRLIAHAS